MASVQEFFEGLPARVTADRIAGDEQHLRLRDRGRRHLDGRDRRRCDDVTEGAGDARRHVLGERGELREDRRGEQNPTTAYMTGKLKIKGDMGAAMKLQKLF